MPKLSNFLITGGEGYIARNLTSYLKDRGHKVLHLNRTKQDGDVKYFIKHSNNEIEYIKNFSHLGKYDIDCIFHLASKYSSVYDKVKIDDLNEASLFLTKRLVSYAEEKEIILIIAGSYIQEAVNIDDSNLAIYYEVKNLGEKLLINSTELTRPTFAVTRQFENYGYFDHRKKILNRIIDAALLGDDMDFINLDVSLDFLHIYDLCSALDSIYVYLDTHRFNKIYKFKISSGKLITLRQITENIEVIMQSRLNIIQNKQTNFDLVFSDSLESLSMPPNWKPKHNLLQDLNKIVINRKLMLYEQGSIE